MDKHKEKYKKVFKMFLVNQNVDSFLGFAYFRIENSEESIKIINSDKGRRFSQYIHYSKTLLFVTITNIVIFFIN